MRYRLPMLLIVLAFFAQLSGCWSIFRGHVSTTVRRFDSAAWRQADPNKESDREIRGSMVDDLMARKLLDQLTKEGTEELLGPPLSARQREMSGMDDEHWHLCYHLGPTRDVPIDEEFLMIRLDEAGRVVEYRVIPN
jgi:hypothetical protein